MAILSIIPYRDDLAHAFRDINIEWIEAMFVVEPHDQHVLDHPRETIIDPGGSILFVAVDGALVGTGALMRTGEGEYELTKMGVRETARGLKAGEFLLSALIAEAELCTACKTLYLLTNSACAAAIHLYEKNGFAHDTQIMARCGSTYDRCDVAMLYSPASD